ncbi:MAG TPA: GNAT family N-acetyltransferase [Streptosporangiaceae bacterium]|nr:GNAT family N-acetyltransferase [Streptosporangiaceae bacterium]
MTEWLSEPLGDAHDLSAFDCGVPALNAWFKEQARRAQVSGTAMTYVWTDGRSARVVAYYAITPHQVLREEVSGGLAGGVSVIPGYLLARLAADQGLHGQGLGGELLHDALDRVVSAADVASGRLVVVDAIDEQAAAFYRHHDFVPVRDNPLRLVMKISTLRKAIGP